MGIPRSTSEKARPAFLSFSGIDGSGKSTQIQNLRASLEQAGLRVRVLAFWDDIAVLKGLRELSSHSLFHSEEGVGTPDKPVNRRDKNVRSMPMTALRFYLYFMDACSLSLCAARANLMQADVVIFDRYLYDELANFNLNGRLARSYVRLLLQMVPHPDIAYFLDVDPAKARARKPEYPLEFLHVNRASYLALSGIAGGITVVPPMAVDEVCQVVANTAMQLLGDHLNPSAEGEKHLPGVKQCLTDK